MTLLCEDEFRNADSVMSSNRASYLFLQDRSYERIGDVRQHLVVQDHRMKSAVVFLNCIADVADDPHS